MIYELIIFSIVIVLYGFFITLAIFGVNKLNHSSIRKSHINGSKFISIIVSVRNEEKNAALFINQLVKQTYPNSLFELIVIDDCSEDNSYAIFKSILEKTQIDFTIIKQTTHKGKKQNISEATQIAKGSIIITTDGDVTYRHANWLLTISNYFEEHNPNLLIMPVDFEEQASLLSLFQITENIGLTGITAGFCGINKPFLCNGANLAFTKKAYNTVNGYTSHLRYSSGEDVFLLEDLKKLDIIKINYSLQKELIVKTQPIIYISDFYNQRLRWAYKSKYSSNFFNLFFGFIVICTNLIFIALAVAIIKKQPITVYLSIFAFTKLIFDFLLLFLASKFLGKAKYLVLLFPFECIYWLYALIIGFASLFIKPYWKGIKVN